MKIDRQAGWLEGAEILPSPNYDDRPDEADITGIVIHNISLPPGQFGGGWIKDLFLNQLDANAHPYFVEIAHLKVSAHVLIRRDGSVQQFVPFHKRAWHAGVSCWEGRERCNDFTIGIEMEGDDETDFTEEQYIRLAEVSKTLLATYPLLTNERITGHEHIAPGRKTDPGPHFDWQYFRELLQT